MNKRCCKGNLNENHKVFAQEHMGRKLNWKDVENVGLRKLIEQLRHQICHNYNIGERYGVNGDTIRMWRSELLKKELQKTLKKKVIILAQKSPSHFKTISSITID